MKRTVLAAVAALSVTTLLPSAQAAPERTLELQAGGTSTFQGAAEVNANPYYFRGAGRLATVAGQEVPPKTLGPFEEGRCSTAAYEQCDDTLVKLVNPVTDAERAKGITDKLRPFTITLTESPARVADFDVVVFRSDAEGRQLGFWTGNATSSQSGNFNAQTPGESLRVDVPTSLEAPSQFMLIRVVRYASPNASYTASLQF